MISIPKGSQKDNEKPVKMRLRLRLKRQFSISSILLLTILVAFVFGLAARRSGEMHRTNELLLEMQADLQAQGILFRAEVTNTDWFTRISTREIPLEVYVFSIGEKNLDGYLETLSNAGVTSINIVSIGVNRESPQRGGFSDRTMELLCRFKVLNFGSDNCPMTKCELEKIRRLRGLGELSLFGDWMTEELFEHLGALNVWKLGVFSPSISEDVFDDLDRFPHLTHVKIRGYGEMEINQRLEKRSRAKQKK